MERCGLSSEMSVKEWAFSLLAGVTPGDSSEASRGSESQAGNEKHPTEDRNLLKEDEP